jgi:hypothetical protein
MFSPFAARVKGRLGRNLESGCRTDRLISGRRRMIIPSNRTTWGISGQEVERIVRKLTGPATLAMPEGVTGRPFAEAHGSFEQPRSELQLPQTDLVQDAVQLSSLRGSGGEIRSILATTARPRYFATHRAPMRDGGCGDELHGFRIFA